MKSRSTSLALAALAAGSMQNVSNTATMELRPSPPMVDNWSYLPRYGTSHSIPTRNQRKIRKARRASFAAGNRKAFA